MIFLDKESLSMFDTMFNEENKQDETDLTQNETVDITINIQGPGAEDQIISDQIKDNENLLKIDDARLKLSDNLDPKSPLKPSQLSEQHPDFKIKSRSTHTYILDPLYKSEQQILNESYEDEMELYLASLPAKVTKEDVLSTDAKQVNLISRVKKEDIISSRSETKKIDKLIATEEKFQRNLHLFCMLEHERQNFLLLPDELINVTRKYHTRSKYDNVINPKKKKEQNSASSGITNNFTSMSTNDPNDFIKSRLEDGAQRLIDNLNVKFESQLNKSHIIIKDDVRLDDNKSVNDSGVGDMETSLETWRIQAEHAVNIIFLYIF
jgi:hypothetical protein